MEPEGSSPHSQQPARSPCEMFRNIISFYGDELLAHRSTRKLEDHHLSAVRDCLFEIFPAAFHIGGRSSIRNLRTRHAAVTGTDLSWVVVLILGFVMLKNIMYCVLRLSTKCGQDDWLPSWYKGYVSPLEDAPRSGKQRTSRVEACCQWHYNCHIDESEQDEGDHAVQPCCQWNEEQKC
jgi:hypothetical protein